MKELLLTALLIVLGSIGLIGLAQQRTIENNQTEQEQTAPRTLAEIHAAEQARREDSTRRRQMVVELDQIIETTPSVRVLHEKMKNDKTDGQAVLDAARSGDLTLIPYFEKLVESAGGNGAQTGRAHVALAILGEKKYLDAIIAETEKSKLSAQALTSDDTETEENEAVNRAHMRRVNAVKNLALVKNPEAMHRLYELLDDTTKPPGGDDYVMPRISNMVIKAMEELSGAENLPKTDGLSEADQIKLWKKWFEERNFLP